MTNQEVMIQVLYKAIGEGISKLIKYGVAFTVLVSCIIALVWLLFHITDLHEADRKEWKSELVLIRKTCEGEINRLREESTAEILKCNESRYALALRVASLEAMSGINKKR